MLVRHSTFNWQTSFTIYRQSFNGQTQFITQNTNIISLVHTPNRRHGVAMRSTLFQRSRLDQVSAITCRPSVVTGIQDRRHSAKNVENRQTQQPPIRGGTATRQEPNTYSVEMVDAQTHTHMLSAHAYVFVCCMCVSSCVCCASVMDAHVAHTTVLLRRLSRHSRTRCARRNAVGIQKGRNANRMYHHPNGTYTAQLCRRRHVAGRPGWVR